MTTIGAQSAAANAEEGTMGTVGGIAATCPNTALEIGVFFDGTGNNQANVAEGPGFMHGASYAAARTNVSLLSALYKQETSQWEQDGTGYCRKYDMIYVEGIGTSANESDYWPDNLTGTINGMGPTGVESRVFQACIDLGTRITLLSGGAEPTEIIVDVFGFSRGAAAARYFVNCFRQGFIEYNGQRASVPEGRNVHFRFIGVFDTVAAIGWADDDDNGAVNVHCSTAQADRIFHLIADDEYRRNFRLNHNDPDGGDFRALPGAHSDVGGGYREGREDVLLEQSEVHTFSNREAAEAARAVHVAEAQAAQGELAQFLADEGWINAGNTDGTLHNMPTPVSIRAVPGIAGMSGTYVYTYSTSARLVREVAAGLSRIPLRIMYDAADNAGVPLAAYPEENVLYAPPEGLPAGVAERMIAGGEPTADERRRMLQGWGHMSSRLNTVKDRMGHAPEEDFDRVVYPNNAGLAK